MSKSLAVVRIVKMSSSHGNGDVGLICIRSMTSHNTQSVRQSGVMSIIKLYGVIHVILLCARLLTSGVGVKYVD